MANKIVALFDDLMFTVKISDAAKRAGVAVECGVAVWRAVQRFAGGLAGSSNRFVRRPSSAGAF